MDFSKLWRILGRALDNAEITGHFDGVAFEKVSYKASGFEKFVLKGWIDEKEGPVCRYSAPWGSFKDGELMHQVHPSDSGFLEIEGEDININTGMGKVSIEGDYMGEDEKAHRIVFTADINLGDIFLEFLS